MSFLGFAKFYRVFNKKGTQKRCFMQHPKQNTGQKFMRNNEAQFFFEVINCERCEAPALGLLTAKEMFKLESDASVLAISGILHHEQE